MAHRGVEFTSGGDGDGRAMVLGDWICGQM